jgi:hypothetical protein
MDENNIPHIVNGGASIMPHEGMKPLPYCKLGELYVQARKDSFGMAKLRPEGGISLAPDLEWFARAIEKAHGIE